MKNSTNLFSLGYFLQRVRFGIADKSEWVDWDPNWVSFFVEWGSGLVMKMGY